MLVIKAQFDVYKSRVSAIKYFMPHLQAVVQRHAGKNEKKNADSTSQMQGARATTTQFFPSSLSTNPPLFRTR